MSIILKKELDPIYETLALLSVENPDKWREEVIRELGSCGLGERFLSEAFHGH
ncbi:hypothetical protein LC724_11590 [Blautia sp. RD014234]|nr:hypothetical protein [Blautia parvula]